MIAARRRPGDRGNRYGDRGLNDRGLTDRSYFSGIVDPADGSFIAFWNMDDFIDDGGGNPAAMIDAFNGINLVCLASSPFLIRSGKINAAVKWPDNAASLQTDLSGSPKLSPHGSFTFWFWASGIGSSGSNKLNVSLTSEVQGGTDMFNVSFVTASSKIRLTSGDAITPAHLDWPTPISDSDWHLIVISWDKLAGLWDLSVDGGAFISSALDGAPNPGVDLESLLVEGIINQMIDAMGYKQVRLTNDFLSELWNNGDGIEYSP